MASKGDFDPATSPDEKYQLDTTEHDSDVDSYYKHEDDGIDVQFTWRAAIIGSILGSIVAASNMYLGLKSGWTFSASIFGAILGFGILKPLSKLPPAWGGGEFGMKENCTVQTAATAAGGLSAGFVAGVPAMFRLGLLDPDITKHWGMFFLWTLAAGFYGLFFAVPLRSYFVIQQKLIFPSPTASANTIRSLHAGDGEEARTQTRWIIYSFLGAVIHKIVGYFVPFLIDMHVLFWFSIPSGNAVLQAIDPLWRWQLQITTAFFGAGMMVGLNTAASFLFGDLLAWAIIGPILFYGDNDIVVKKSPWGYSKEKATVQSWNLWIGIVIMLCASFTELFMQYKSLWNGVKGGFIQLWNLIAKVLPIKKIDFDGSDNKDPVSEHELIPTWMWMSGTLVSLILTILVLYFYFDMNVGAGILAALLGFVFSFIGCQSSGETDINPTGVIGKASQFVFAGIHAETLQLTQLHNLIAGVLSASCGSQTVDMVGDLKTGHLLRASPRSQFYAQIVGSVFGIVIAVVLFVLFGKAYPCILVKEPEGAPACTFPVPAVSAWAGVTEALTSDILKMVPESCRIACLVFGLVTIATIVLKNTYLKKYSAYIPNWNAIGVAFVNPAPYIPVANFIGALIALVWNKINPRYWSIMGIALASGLIAGEGIGGVFHAIFNIAGVTEEEYSTTWAMPV
ncbi:OPT superfamily oligopeptide transporter [Neoconidiobolus thromboides FSU 785]|nr:OPT superfamily oligopeptide transporter [Neoconidiobolus thromboides FSU 785]